MDLKSLRDDFPIYQSKEKDVIYFDNACQTLRPRAVMQAMDEYYSLYPACGGRSVHRMATTVSIKVEEARERIGEFLGAPPSERHRLHQELHRGDQPGGQGDRPEAR